MKIADKTIILVCDDIRHETGGKVSLMGIYHDIIIESFPTTFIKICVAIILENIHVELKSAQVKVSFPGVDQKTISLAPPAEPGQNMTMNVTLLGIQMVTQGEATIEIVFNEDKRTKVVHKFNVKDRKKVAKGKKQAKSK